MQRSAYTAVSSDAAARARRHDATLPSGVDPLVNRPGSYAGAFRNRGCGWNPFPGCDGVGAGHITQEAVCHPVPGGWLKNRKLLGHLVRWCWLAGHRNLPDPSRQLRERVIRQLSEVARGNPVLHGLSAPVSATPCAALERTSAHLAVQTAVRLLAPGGREMNGYSAQIGAWRAAAC